jgi:hypothetical protein
LVLRPDREPAQGDDQDEQAAAGQRADQDGEHRERA